MDIIKAQQRFIEAQQEFIAVLMKNQANSLMTVEDDSQDVDTGFISEGSIGKNLLKLRKRKGISQIRLAKQLGIGNSMLCQIEKGMKIPSLPVALGIAKALECTLDELCVEDKSDIEENPKMPEETKLSEQKEEMSLEIKMKNDDLEKMPAFTPTQQQLKKALQKYGILIS